MQTLAFTHGWGRHFFFLSDIQRVKAMEMVFVSEPLGRCQSPSSLALTYIGGAQTNQIVAITCSMLGRVSFIFLLLRLFGNTKVRRWFLYVLMAQQLIVNLFTSITIFTQCGNVHSLWNPVGEPSKCWSPDVQTDTGYVQGGKKATSSSCSKANNPVVFNSATDLLS
jgi:Na+(H+)/acetate symporter ActP